jgi:threonine/homoserine/homoserine lactone efflux protein
MSALLVFIGVSLIVIMTPGPDTAMTIRNTLLGGRAAGIFTALGISVGLTIWAVATSAGLVALLIASKPIFLALKYAGAAYLVYLGFQALREAVRPSSAEAAAQFRPAGPRLSRFRAFRQGVVSDLGNPKIAVFFASLLPQFVPAGEPEFTALLLRGCLFAAMTFAWLVPYVFAVAKAGDFLKRPAVRRTLEGITGFVLVGLGIRVAAEH